MHNCEPIQHDDHCAPTEPCDEPGTQEVCEGTIRIPCCCPRLHTRSFVINIGPRTEAQLMSYVAATANAYEATGWLVLAHSLTDTGGGWLFNLTVGWYA